jgi:hypothetical protein
MLFRYQRDFRSRDTTDWDSEAEKAAAFQKFASRLNEISWGPGEDHNQFLVNVSKTIEAFRAGFVYSRIPRALNLECCTLEQFQARYE